MYCGPRIKFAPVYIQFTGFTWWLQLYIERTEPPLNIAEVHPIYRSEMSCIWIFGEKCVCFANFLYNFMFISSLFYLVN
jgi:hypothetical protein